MLAILLAIRLPEGDNARNVRVALNLRGGDLMMRADGRAPSMASATSILLILAVLFGPSTLALGQGVGTEAKTPNPPGVDFFNLTLQQTRALSRTKNFEVVGHSYFKGPWLTPFAQQTGIGAGFNTPRVYDGIAYLAGYASPITLFAILIADVRDPANMNVLSVIPCKPGTRCPYLRVNTGRHILIATHDTNRDNPRQPQAGDAAGAGVGFYDISNPRRPKGLGFLVTRENGATHGFDIDDRYVYACANTPPTKDPKFGGGNQEVVIIDYGDPGHPTLVSTVHIQGQHTGETFEPRDRQTPEQTPQHIWCHEIIKHKDRLYVAWRDAGLVIIDVSVPSAPKIISRLDYVPPFSGGSLGAAHTAAPVIVNPTADPKLVVVNDEIFDCPPGITRIVDISDLSNPQFISNYRIPAVDDNYNDQTGKFVCAGTVQSSHLPWFDYRSSGLIYQAWYDQGLHAWDISNPYTPREVGYYFSPRYPCTGPCGGGYPGAVHQHSDRHVREVFQDPATGLLYATDGNGGGLTVLRWTGPIPRPPMPLH